ncbi:MAG: glycosyltransferase family 4 protein [Bacteroidota bacterium]
MRICHVGVEIVPSSNGAYVGGLVKNVATIAERQAVQGHEPEIFTSDVRKSTNGRQKTYLGSVHRIRTWGRYGSAPFAATFVERASTAIRKAHRGQPFDLIHVHSAYSLMGAMGFLLKRLQVPTVFSLYSLNLGVWPGHYHHSTSAHHRGVFTRRLLETFNKIIVPSANLKSHLIGLGICEDRVAQIPPALAPTMFQPLPSKEQAREDLNIPPEKFVVLYLGNYSQWKGIELLLEAMKTVHHDSPETTLFTAWGEPYRWSGNRKESILCLIDRYGLQKIVQQVGIVEDVRYVLRASDVLVSPFQCMCKVLDYPLSILEAMACERPVISTRVGGVVEVLEDRKRGILVDPHDVSGLISAIEMLKRNPRKAVDMGLQGARWAQEHFRPEVVSNRIESLYSDLMVKATIAS